MEEEDILGDPARGDHVWVKYYRDVVRISSEQCVDVEDLVEEVVKAFSPLFDNVPPYKIDLHIFGDYNALPFDLDLYELSRYFGFQLPNTTDCPMVITIPPEYDRYQQRLSELISCQARQECSLANLSKLTASKMLELLDDICCVCWKPIVSVGAPFTIQDVETEIRANRIALMHCGHGFHDECISEWICERHICPICRRFLL